MIKTIYELCISMHAILNNVSLRNTHRNYIVLVSKLKVKLRLIKRCWKKEFICHKSFKPYSKLVQKISTEILKLKLSELHIKHFLCIRF